MQAGSEIAAEKARIRLDLKNRFKALKAQAGFQSQRQNLIIGLSKWLQNQQGIWTSYLSMDSELDLQELNQSCGHLDFAYPKILDGKMQFIKAGPNGFAKGSFGILEPVEAGAQKIELAEIAGFLVPGLGFDRRGVRMGRGKGFYDQILERAPGIKVGITFKELIEPQLPEEIREEFGRDVRMDYLATELGVQSVLS